MATWQGLVAFRTYLGHQSLDLVRVGVSRDDARRKLGILEAFFDEPRRLSACSKEANDNF